MSKQENEIVSRLERIEESLRAADPLLNTTEAAKYLHLSKSYLFKLTSQNRIPFYKPEGKKNYFRKSELDQWLTRKRFATKEEIENAAILKMKDKRRARA